MTNVNQHSADFGTSFGIIGTLGGLLRSAPLNGAILLTTCYSTSKITARRIRRRNRQLRLQ
jgi:hypothetical protein